MQLREDRPALRLSLIVDPMRAKAAIVLVSGMVAASLCGGCDFAKREQEANEKQAAQNKAQAEVDADERRAATLRKQAEEANANVERLRAAVAKEPDPTKKAQLEAQLVEAEARAKTRPTGPKSSTQRVCNCLKTDPLCDCL